MTKTPINLIPKLQGPGNYTAVTRFSIVKPGAVGQCSFVEADGETPDEAIAGLAVKLDCAMKDLEVIFDCRKRIINA